MYKEWDMKCSEMRQVLPSLCCLDGKVKRPVRIFSLLPRDRVKGERRKGGSRVVRSMLDCLL